MFRSAALAGLLATGCAHAVETATPNDIPDPRPGAFAFVNATVYTEPGRRLEDATIVVDDGRIITVGEDAAVPEGHAVVDLRGRYVYPGLIDLDARYGLPEPPPRAPFSFRQPEVVESQRPGAYNANEAIKADHSAAAGFSVDPEAAATWRAMGFAAGLTHMPDGIARGSGALVSFADAPAQEALLVPEATAHFSFDKGSSAQSYPISPMGSIALLRQTFLDAQWYAQQQPRPFVDRSLEAWIEHAGRPWVFSSDRWQSLLRADAVGDEFGVQFVITSGGDDYQRIDAVAATGATLIVPLEFPEAPDVRDPFEAERVSLGDLKHWELAPTNPAVLEAAGIPFALTSAGKEKSFWKNLRKAIEHGLSEERALAALTTVPAAVLGVEERLGRVAAGQGVHLLITSGPLFDEATVVEELWIGGRRHVVDGHTPDLRGRFALRVGEARYELDVTGTPARPEAEVRVGDEDAEPRKAEFTVDDGGVTLAFSPREGAGAVRLGGWITDAGWAGRGQGADGAWLDWSAQRLGEVPEEPEEEGDEAGAGPDDTEVGEVIFPFTAYGSPSLPEAEDLLIRNATVWTMEAAGVLEEADVLIRGGRIAAVGRGLQAGDARIVDATGRHVTPGIIDEHSHIALSGVNDVATLSAMVRMGDVVDSEDVDIYRNLAGGVTAAQLLHGSANPVGGQSALIKMRWGSLPREMLIEEAPGFIKFALGENVKRSRNPDSIRYPQSRMGVEQVYRAGFSAARDYRQRWADYEALPDREKARTPAPRRDLVLDALAEILAGERRITCHSYVQSEINMLMHVADDFGFKVNTFTHILEGYKVADRMAAHGAGGSSFADWWAYKWEVRYAIPYNAALMHQAGVNVAINSDSAEMARRLNQEAAKAVKYGGLSEVDALATVTSNPARLLGLDARMGSIREGKDADLVVWTAHPLSMDAIADMTLLDGVVRFDRERDAELRKAVLAERARLIAKAGKARSANGKGGGNGWKPKRAFQCDSLHGYEYLVEVAR